MVFRLSGVTIVHFSIINLREGFSKGGGVFSGTGLLLTSLSFQFKSSFDNPRSEVKVRFIGFLLEPCGVVLFGIMARYWFGTIFWVREVFYV